MSAVAAFLFVLGVSLVQAVFFGCTLAPTGNYTTVGSGSVACVSGTQDGVSSLACQFQFNDLTSNVQAAHWHVGGPTSTGPATFIFDVSALTSISTRGTNTNRFTATSGFSQQGATGFDAQVAACVTGCYFNLHTDDHTDGELRCQAAALNPIYDFDTTLVAAPGVTAPTSTGSVHVWMAEILPAVSPRVHAWGYNVAFQTQSNVTNAHIHVGTSLTDNSGPVAVFLDWTSISRVPRNTGSFIGVALEGVTQGTIQPHQQYSAWPTKTAALDTAIANHFAYVNIHTQDNGAGEIRANISPNSASQVTLALMAIVFMVASWMAL
jgi:hypothetical protein